MSSARLRTLLVTLLLAAVGAGAGLHARAGATEEPIYLEWAQLLPGLSDRYDPGSANDCVAGRSSCIAAAVREMDRRYRPLAQQCSHNAAFAMTYLRVTQTYLWSTTQPGYYADVRWMNHSVAVFAKYYLRAFDAWTAGNYAAVPQAWLLALDAARNGQVAGSGNLMLGINAHINRDLAFAMAAAGLVGPSGASKKADFDRVNQVLNSVTFPLMDELAARFDPSTARSDSPFGLDSAATGNLMFAWREQAWRNAEALTRAPTEPIRTLLTQQIEANSMLQARSWLAAMAYTPPVTDRAARDTWCAQHHDDPAPTPYPFGLPRG